MRFLSLSVIHARMAARQRAIWVASLLLALLSMGVAVNTGLPFETGDVADLVFLAQMLAMLPPVAYAAAFTDLAAEPERLGISEVEASAPVRPMELTVARVVGALAVMTSPSAALLLFCAAGQMLHGNVWAPLQAIVLFAGVVLPAAFVAAALSALAGSLLPRIVARIVSVAAWLGTLFACSFKGVPASGGGVQFHIASDPLAQAFFGSQPFLDYQGPAPAAAPFEALALLVFKFAVAAALLAAAAAVARRARPAGGGGLSISAALLASQPDPIAVRIVSCLLGRLGEFQFGAAHLTAVVALSRSPSPSGTVSLPHSLTARRVYGELILVRGARRSPPFAPVSLSVPGEAVLPSIGWTIACRRAEAPEQPPDTPDHFFLNPSRLTGPLVIRPRLTGDTITLPRRRAKTVKKLLIDAKVPRWDRDRLPLLADASGPLWLAGFGPDQGRLSSSGAPALEVIALRTAPAEELQNE